MALGDVAQLAALQFNVPTLMPSLDPGSESNLWVPALGFDGSGLWVWILDKVLAPNLLVWVQTLASWVGFWILALEGASGSYFWNLGSGTWVLNLDPCSLGPGSGPQAWVLGLLLTGSSELQQESRPREVRP